MSAPFANSDYRKKVSSLDVARRAGVSRATVSRCFTDGAAVRSSTRQRVLDAAKDLGYEPNLLARMLNKQESSIVAVLTTDFMNPFQPALMEALTESIRAENLTPLLLKAGSVHESADALIQLALSYRVAAIVVTVINASRESILRSFEAGVPLIFLNRVSEETPAISICSNGKSGAHRIAEILVEGGTTKIGMITGRLDSWTNSMRRGGFRQKLDELGYDVVASVQGNFTYRGGYNGTLHLIDENRRLNAIYACNDVMAFGALDAIRARGVLRIPEDISVIGFDDVPMASWGAYRLSTIHQPVRRMIRQIREVLKRPDRGLELSGEVFLYDGRFMQRSTTRPVSLKPEDEDEGN